MTHINIQSTYLQPTLIVLAITLLAILFCQPTLAAIETHVYTSQHTASNQLQRSIKKLYPEATLSSQGNQLIIRAEDTDLTQIKELLPLLDKPIQQYTLVFSSTASNKQSTTISTRSGKLDNKQFSISDGETLTFDYRIEQQQLTSLGRFNTSLEQVATDKDGLSITVKSVAENIISVSYRQYRLQNGERTLIQNTAQLTLGSWLALGGENGGESSNNTRHYGTKSQSKLYIRVITSKP